jgi:hypothetical protein
VSQCRSWFQTSVGADADTAVVDELSVTAGNIHDGMPVMALYRMILAMYSPTVTIAIGSQCPPFWPKVVSKSSFQISARRRTGDPLS